MTLVKSQLCTFIVQVLWETELKPFTQKAEL